MCKDVCMCVCVCVLVLQERVRDYSWTLTEAFIVARSWVEHRGWRILRFTKLGK